MTVSFLRSRRIAIAAGVLADTPSLYNRQLSIRLPVIDRIHHAKISEISPHLLSLSKQTSDLLSPERVQDLPLSDSPTIGG
jgi:hypothetical protein